MNNNRTIRQKKKKRIYQHIREKDYKKKTKRKNASGKIDHLKLEREPKPDLKKKKRDGTHTTFR